MISVCDKLSRYKLSTKSAIQMIVAGVIPSEGDHYFIRLVSLLRALDDVSLLEASSLHKFLFFAEVDSEEGVKKFLKRTHTKRKIDRKNLLELVAITKREFVINYFKRNSVLPTILGPKNKITLLENIATKNDISGFESYGLLWWYNLKFGKCFNWTDAGNPVEYAKDKGALKTNITFGPKDSQGELMQVMSDEDYNSPDFLLDINTEISGSDVYYTHTCEFERPAIFPCRLCEKEKEPKPEGRLFGVANSKIKHRLSIYMAKSKLFLDFLEEQSMTITDKARKQIQHEMSQDLVESDMFAVMMDIEGHNQSMQPENYSELLEFVGDTFGEEGWGKTGKSVQ